MQITVFYKGLFSDNRKFNARKLPIQNVVSTIFISLSLKQAQWDQYFKQTFGKGNTISQI